MVKAFVVSVKRVIYLSTDFCVRADTEDEASLAALLLLNETDNDDLNEDDVDEDVYNIKEAEKDDEAECQQCGETGPALEPCKPCQDDKEEYEFRSKP
jgi:hypothetical protein